MKFNVKLAMAIALAGSAATVASAQTDARLFTVAQRAVQNNDFTTAAESTINGVVCIKS